jgi:arylsulfatase
MRTRTTLATAAMLTVGALLGWLAASGLLNIALGQDKRANSADLLATAGTPSVLPRPDFHFQGNVGRTYLDSDPPSSHSRYRHPRVHPTLC